MTQRIRGGRDVKAIFKNIMAKFFPLLMEKNPQIIASQRIPRMMKKKEEEGRKELKKQGGKKRKEGQHPCIYVIGKTLRKIKCPKSSEITNLKRMAARPKVFFIIATYKAKGRMKSQ